MRILIVEDDASIAKMMQVTLTMDHHETVWCEDGLKAFEWIRRDHDFDLILLDVMLPGMDGFELFTKIRDLQIPVIFVTARQEVEDRVFGLKLGAEDYIVKPFHAMELLARVEVVGRRYAREEGTGKLTYRDIEANQGSHTVKVGGQGIDLTPKEYEVLLYFLKHPGRAVRKEELLNHIWGFEYLGESRTVDIHVQKVRRKCMLQNELQTLPRIGYRLEGEA